MSFREFNIQFAGLKPGNYAFDYTVDNAFFKLFDNALITDAVINFNVTLDKKPRFFTLLFELSGTMAVQCDRCGDMFNYDISGNEGYTLLVKTENRAHDDDLDEDIVYVHEGEGSINIATYLYEYAVLSIPLHPIHPDVDGKQGCNQETLKRLKEILLDSPILPDEDITLEEINLN